MKCPDDLFLDRTMIKKIQVKLPKLFYLAEIESQRAGKIGMEIGSLRERILVALLIYRFGRDNVILTVLVFVNDGCRFALWEPQII